MNYNGYLISNFATGLDKQLQPWLNPDDSQETLLDGFVYLGVWQVRDGYTQFATGQRGSNLTYCESRMVHNIANELIGAADGVLTTFDHTTSNKPLRRGSVQILYTIGAVPLIATDNGLGGFSGTSIDTALSTIDYTTGEIHLVFSTAPDNLTNVTTTYDYHQGFPVMGVMNFYTQANTRELIVADTTYINRFNPTTNRLDDITGSSTLTGNETNFLSWTMYKTPQDIQRLLFVNYNDSPKQYSGSTVTSYPIYTASNQQTSVASGVLGDGVNATFVINTPANTGIVPGTLTINETTTPQAVTDNLFGNLQGDGIGTVDYLSGTINVTFNTIPPLNAPINLTYKQLTTPIETALHLFDFKDRLVVLSTIENGGTRYGLRIRISGTGAYGDIFTQDAIGAGLIDIPDKSFVTGADFNRDDLLIFTNSSLWILKYTSNDVVPFSLDKIDGTRGSEAPFGTVTYLNRTNAISSRGLIVSDGYSVERSDNKIPQYSFNNVNSSRYAQCYAGTVDEDRDHYLIHPSPSAQISDSILVTNYEEENFSVYRIPLSCMGEFINQYDITWNDLLQYQTWDEMAADYKNWNSFAYTKGTPFSVGGGHHGQITRLNDVETEDYPVKIRDISVVDIFTVQVTTDFQEWKIGDVINFNSINGMVELNQKQVPIVSVIDEHTFTVFPINTSRFNPYIDSGTCSKVIAFDSKTKKFNPFANADQKVRCGWVYFYVSTSGCDLTDNINIINATQSNPCVLTIPGHGYTTGTQVLVDGVNGMTQLNKNFYNVTVIDSNTVSLDGTDSTAYSAYTSLGFTSTPSNAKLQVRVITNDTEQPTQLNGYDEAPYEVNLSNLPGQIGIKTWYKIWVNQIGRFIQLQFGNAQAGAKVQIHAVMPGFAGLGRLI